MEFAVAALVVLAVVAFVVLPLVRGVGSTANTVATQAAAQERAAIYQELIELELDQRVGKVSEADFREQSDILLARAAGLISAEDAQQAAADEQVEREIAAVRATLDKPTGATRRTEPAREAPRMIAIRLWLMAVVLAGVVTAALSAPAHAQDAGVIEGLVTNGSAGAGAPADVEVVVHMLQNRQKTGERRVRTDGAGRFRVEGLSTSADMLYFPILEYQSIAMSPERPVTFESGPLAQTAITVFETTPFGEALSFERFNMLVMGVSPTSLTIMEMGAVTNASDRTFAADPAVTGSGRTLRFLLPPGAIQITPQAGLPGDTLEGMPDGFASTDPVRPGRREIAFSYQLPYDSSSLDMNRMFAFPARTFTLFVPDEVGGVIAPDMAMQGTADLGGRPYRQYVAEGVAAGGSVRFRLTGLPAPMFARPRDLGLLVAGIGTVLLGGFVGFTIWRRRKALAAAADRAEVASPTGTVMSDARLAPAESIARLDERFAAGEIERDAYDAERAEQKARLLALTGPASAAR